MTPMAKKTKNANRRIEAWIDARTRHHLTDAQIQMARELGMNPAKLGKQGVRPRDDDSWLSYAANH